MLLTQLVVTKNRLEQVTQLSQRYRTAGWVSNGQKLEDSN